MRSHLRIAQPEKGPETLKNRQRASRRGPRLLVILSFLMISLTTGTLVFSMSLLGLPQTISEMTVPPAIILDTTAQSAEKVTLAESAATDVLVRESPGLNCATAADENKSWFIRQDRGLPILMRGVVQPAKPKPDPTVTPEPSATPEPTATPMPTATPVPTAKPKPTTIPKPTATPKPTAAPTPTTAPTPEPIPSGEPIEITPPASTPTPSPSAASSPLTAEQQQMIIDLARAQVGVRYVYGKMDPAIGFDCSGLTCYIYKTLFNISLPRSAKDQWGFGIPIAYENIAIGDIICFDYFEPYGICDHVGIYIGNGLYIHASTSDRTYYTDSGAVKEVPVNYGKRPIISIRRIIY